MKTIFLRIIILIHFCNALIRFSSMCMLRTTRRGISIAAVYISHSICYAYANLTPVNHRIEIV